MKPRRDAPRSGLVTPQRLLLSSASVALLLALASASLAAQSSAASSVRDLLSLARSARYQQDSALASYQAIARQRISIGLGVARGLSAASIMAGIGAAAVGRERLAARYESVARVGWHRERGPWAEVIAARAVVPLLGEMEPDPADQDEDAALVLPYAPGRDRLWPVDELSQALPGDWIEHPLAPGADSLYSFAVGDSLTFHFGDGTTLLLRELRVRPRRPESRLIVGSLWLDARSGDLVRAAYRPSVPMDLWPLIRRDISRDDQDKVEKFGPFEGTVREVIVEHGRYGRFWLPRVRTASAEGTARGVRVTASITQTFRYEGVQAGEPRPPLASVPPAGVDPRTGRVRRPQWYGVQDRTGRCRERGDSSAQWSPDSLVRDNELSIMFAEGVRFRVLYPCNPVDLVHSPALPASIYTDEDELFPAIDLEALRSDVQQAFALSRQAEWEPQPWVFQYGWHDGLTRYNRVEGLSLGASAQRELGNGYSVRAVARAATADREPGIEIGGMRSNASSAVGVAAYHRLVAANDWGAPFGLGASLNALLFGRDDGFYYRATGVEVGGRTQPALYGMVFDWRLFAERQRTAKVGTNVSVPNLVSDREFQSNVTAAEGNWLGVAASTNVSAGSDPRGTRGTFTARVESGLHERNRTGYGRYLGEATVAQGFGEAWNAVVTLGAGTSSGSLPPQRLWFLGGAHTVRGHRSGALGGDAFWLARGELSVGHPMVRPAIFADLGWAGQRSGWSRGGDELAGAGFGASFLDGLVRLDVSRGLTHERQVRVDLYLDPR